MYNNVWFILILGHFIVGFITAITLYKVNKFPFVGGGGDTVGDVGFCVIITTLTGYLAFIIMLLVVLIFQPLGRLVEKYL